MSAQPDQVLSLTQRLKTPEVTHSSVLQTLAWPVVPVVREFVLEPEIQLMMIWELSIPPQTVVTAVDQMVDTFVDLEVHAMALVQPGVVAWEVELAATEMEVAAVVDAAEEVAVVAAATVVVAAASEEAAVEAAVAVVAAATVVVASASVSVPAE